MRAKFVNESLLRQLTPEDIIEAICKKLKEKGESGAVTNPSNWKLQIKRGFGTYDSTFFNKKAEKSAAVTHTDDTVIEIDLGDNESSSPFGGSSFGSSPFSKPLFGAPTVKHDNPKSRDWFSTFSEEREKEKEKQEILDKRREYAVEEKPIDPKDTIAIFTPEELFFQALSNERTGGGTLVVIKPKDNIKFKKMFGVNNPLFGNYFKPIKEGGFYITILSLAEARKFLKKAGMTEMDLNLEKLLK